ncbi:hypothetical protein [Mesorhizobium ciceri]|uniref:hypothetical protein n=1 Tax=Mesorhizobium TaxID=68287 RepID=UPI00047EAE94|nr:hypothetical protein [Mesorhizobium ciceri]
MLNETNFNGCKSYDNAQGKGLGNRELESAEHSSEAPTGQNMLYFPGAPLLGSAIVKTSPEIPDAAEQGTAPLSAKLAQLATAIADRISLRRNNVGDGTVQILLHGGLLGGSRLTISYRHDTVQIFIESERLWLMQQFQGHAFARDLSNRLGIRVVVMVGARCSAEEQGNDGDSRGPEGVLHYLAEKGS